MTSDIKAECILNREGDVLPFGYYNPETDGKLTWVCNVDKDNKITSVFDFKNPDGTHEKQCNYLENADKAKYVRDELINNGWKKMVPPEVTFKFPGEKGERPLNRSEKRKLAKKIKQANSKNPFKET